MPVRNLSLFVLPVCIVAFWSAMPLPSAVADSGCSKQTMDDLNRDKANTAFFLDTAAERACVGKNYTASGTVKQVYSKDELELTAADGLGVTASLAPTHGCGDLLAIKKGDPIRVKGTTVRAYRTVAAIRVREASCY